MTSRKISMLAAEKFMLWPKDGDLYHVGKMFGPLHTGTMANTLHTSKIASTEQIANLRRFL